MPGNTINFELKLNSNIKSETKDAKEFRREITGAAKAAQNIEYGRASGIIGKTGASARDFANQAQGLGGLVRVYAALAANIYAVTAAFNMLSQAMNTANMVEGLNQLGAQSGQALGSLSKRFIDVTGNAISLREAMEATAQASAAGLSSEQFLKLGEVAKKASQALGRDTVDSVNRLTRGIVKLEPELLDELGIFTKLEKSTEDYARSIGKSASQLTDFEKRQAFANAALKEGLDKFGAINLDTNPYDKLLATLKNTLQVTLELVNVGVKPLVDFLNSNPVALKALLAGLAALVAKQFIPAIRDWRANIGQGAEEAQKALAVRKKAAETATEAAKQSALVQKDIAAEKWVKQVDIAENKLKTVSGGMLTPKAKAIISKADLTDITQKEIDYIEKLGNKNTKLAAQYKELAAALNMAKRAHEDYLKTEQRQQQRIDKPGIFTPLAVAKRDEERARRTSAGRQLVSQVYETAGSAGIGSAFKQLFSGISTEKLGAIRGFMTGISGTAVIAARGVGLLASGLMSLSGYIGAAVGVYQIFDSALSRNSKQVEAFNDAISKSADFIDNANRVQKEYGSEISTNAIYARANALDSLSQSAQNVTEKFVDALNASSAWDTLGDKIKSIFGFGLQADFATNTAETWAAELRLIPEGPLRSAIEAKIKAAAGTSSLSIEDIIAGLRGQPRSQVAERVKDVNTAITEQGKLQKAEAATAKVVQENFKSVDKAAQNVINTLKITDPIGQFGEELLKLGMNMGKAFQFAQAGVATLKDALKDAQTLRFVDPKALEQLRSIEATLPEITKNLDYWNQKAAEAQKLVDEKNSPILKAIKDTEARTDITQAQKDLVIGGLRQTLKPREQEAEAAQNMRAAYQKAFNDLRAQLGVITKNISVAGAEYINKAYTAAVQQAAISASRFILKGTEGTIGASQRQLELTLKELDIQQQQISIAEKLNETMIQNSIINEKGNALLELDRLERKQKTPGETLSAEELARFEDVRVLIPSLNTLLKDIQGNRITNTVTSQIPIIQSFLSQIQLGRTQTQAARVVAGQKRTEAGIEAELGSISERQKADNIILQNASERLKKQQELNSLQETGLEYLTATEIAEKQRLQTLGLQDQQKRATKQIDDELELVYKRITKATGNDLRLLEQKRTDLNNQKISLEEIQGYETRILNIQQEQAKIANILTQTLTKREQSYKISEQGFKAQEQEVSGALDLLQVQNQINPMQADEYAQREKILKLKQIDLEATRSLAQVEKDREDNRLRVQADIDKLLSANPEADTTEILNRLAASNQYYTTEATNLRRSIDLKKESLNLTYSLNDRQKNYDQVFTNSFNSMADTIVQWAQTGKFAGKELFNSLTADLLRYELRLQTIQLYSTALRPFVLDFAGSIAGKAKGEAYMGAIQPFAKGGMFTNSIVTQPTLFRFAKGTGLMGEAGPEAIMPLKRDGQGRLGVSAQNAQPKVEVIVNNNSQAQAQTTETVDSRGNRKIEVTIGDMVANEMSRTGSTTQRTMQAGYGLQPRLIRR